MAYKEIIDKINKRSAKIGIIGLGYVGLPLVIRFCEEGFSVTGFDVDPAKTGALNKGIYYIKHIPSPRIAGITKPAGNKAPAFVATTDMSQLKNMDAVIICVPT